MTNWEGKPDLLRAPYEARPFNYYERRRVEPRTGPTLFFNDLQGLPERSNTPKGWGEKRENLVLITRLWAIFPYDAPEFSLELATGDKPQIEVLSEQLRQKAFDFPWRVYLYEGQSLKILYTPLKTYSFGPVEITVAISGIRVRTHA